MTARKKWWVEQIKDKCNWAVIITILGVFSHVLPDLTKLVQAVKGQPSAEAHAGGK